MTGERRLRRVNQLLREELSRVIRFDVKDPRVADATITEVKASPDLAQATVFVRTLTGDPAEETLRGLAHAEAFIRGELGRELHLRRIPELHFREDRALEHARRIEELLGEARGADESGGAGEAGGAGEPGGADEAQDAGENRGSDHPRGRGRS